MEALQIKLDDQDILRDGVSGIYYTQRNWRQLTVSDNASDHQGWHGRVVSPTFARVRVITLEGYIDRMTNENENIYIVEYLERLFSLQADPSQIVPKKLYVKDVYDREWSLDVKIKEPFEIYEWDANFKWSHWTWRVVLESVGDPTYTTPEALVINWVEWAYWWFTLGTSLPFSMWLILNSISVTNEGNSASYPRIEVTVWSTWSINTPLVIRNMTTQEAFSLDVSCVPGDIIVIDSENMQCTKNGDDITAFRVIGSVWPKVFWTNRFFIEDSDGGIIDSDFSFKFYYKNSLL